MFRRFALGLTLFTLAGLSGCVAQLQHQPNTGLVRELGKDKAEERLRDIMIRARGPQITDAEVQDDAVVYSATGISPWWYTPFQGKAAILFSALARIDLYENARTFLYDAGGAELSAITHQNVEDAREFIDLLLSFQAWWRDGGDEGQGPAKRDEPDEVKTDLMQEDGGSKSAEPEGDEVKKDLMQDD
ncbi:MAG: hypothetical protein KDD82_03015 [Planctomycetes bacterium]|nr:hypothetical protein [Planctomycetota bacterium]